MVQTVVKYSNGGKVQMPGPDTRKMPQRPLPQPKRGPAPKRIGHYADGGEVKKTPPPKPNPNRDTIPSPKPESTADALRNQRKRQEQLLGLKDGGKVSKKRAIPASRKVERPGPMLTPDQARAKLKMRNGGKVKKR